MLITHVGRSVMCDTPEAVTHQTDHNVTVTIYCYTPGAESVIYCTNDADLTCDVGQYYVMRETKTPCMYSSTVTAEH